MREGQRSHQNRDQMPLFLLRASKALRQVAKGMSRSLWVCMDREQHQHTKFDGSKNESPGSSCSYRSRSASKFFCASEMGKIHQLKGREQCPHDLQSTCK